VTDELHAADVELAAACARGEPAAIAAFDRAYGAELDGAIARSPRLGIARDEFRQLVRTRLFVGAPGKPARIASYTGDGPLKAWVRVTAARVVIDLARAHDDREQPADDAMLARLASPHDPALLLLQSAYGAHVQDAFREGLAQLSVRQRNLLRQHFVDGERGRRDGGQERKGEQGFPHARLDGGAVRRLGANEWQKVKWPGPRRTGPSTTAVSRRTVP